MVPLFSIMIRRDAHTTTPVSVPAYEVSILQAIFGAENVLNFDGKLIKEAGLGDPVGEYQPNEEEFTRLSQRYGGNDKGSFVEQVYGLASTGKLDDAIANSVQKPAKAAKAKE